MEDVNGIGIEQDKESFRIAEFRVAAWKAMADKERSKEAT